MFDYFILYCCIKFVSIQFSAFVTTISCDSHQMLLTFLVFSNRDNEHIILTPVQSSSHCYHDKTTAFGKTHPFSSSSPCVDYGLHDVKAQVKNYPQCQHDLVRVLRLPKQAP